MPVPLKIKHTGEALKAEREAATCTRGGEARRGVAGRDGEGGRPIESESKGAHDGDLENVYMFENRKRKMGIIITEGQTVGIKRDRVEIGDSIIGNVKKIYMLEGEKRKMQLIITERQK